MKYLPIYALALLFLSFRDNPRELVLREAITLPHPEIAREISGSDQFWEPKITLLCIETRDGKERFYLRAAKTPQDAGMMFRTIEPRENQLLRR